MDGGEGVRAGCCRSAVETAVAAAAAAVPGGGGCTGDGDETPPGVSTPEPAAAALPSRVVGGVATDGCGCGVSPSAAVLLLPDAAAPPPSPQSPPPVLATLLPPPSAVSSATIPSGSPSVGSSGGRPGWHRLHHRRHPSRVI